MKAALECREVGWLTGMAFSSARDLGMLRSGGPAVVGAGRLTSSTRGPGE